MSYYKKTGESRCEWCGKYIPVGASYYTHNRNDSYATGAIFCCEEHMHLYDEKTGNKLKFTLSEGAGRRVSKQQCLKLN